MSTVRLREVQLSRDFSPHGVELIGSMTYRLLRCNFPENPTMRWRRLFDGIEQTRVGIDVASPSTGNRASAVGFCVLSQAAMMFGK